MEVIGHDLLLLSTDGLHDMLSEDDMETILSSKDSPAESLNRLCLAALAAGGTDDMTVVGIFQPFYTTKKKGTGLGLSIVKKIMEAHGSTVHVSSEEGRGTIVKLHFQGVHDEEDPDH